MNSLFSCSGISFLIIVGLSGLIIGSFLNVVIYRLPLMSQNTTAQNKNSLNLWFPRSFCDHCGVTIPFYLNVPLLSYLILFGKSQCCKESISLQYPFVEGLTTCLFLLLGLKQGATLLFIFSVVFTCSLLVLTFIDLATLTLPDQITLPMIGLGLCANYFTTFCSRKDAVIGSIAGYIVFLSIEKVAFLIKKKESLGRGDCKLMAMLGAWLGWESLPLIIFIGSFIGSIAGTIYILKSHKEFTVQLPFGPFLALGGFILLYFGRQLIEY